MRTGIKKHPLSCVLVTLLFLAALMRAHAAEVMPPKPAHYFNDYANVVSASTAGQLNNALENFERETSSQIVVAVFPKMQSDSSIEDYTQRIAQNWGVGQKDKNNGAVLFVFIEDRKMFIQVGYGLEGAMPDALAKRIIEDEIKPHFRGGDYTRGLTAGVNAMIRATKGEYEGTGRTGAARKPPTPVAGYLILLILAFIFFGIISSRFFRRGKIYTRRGSGTYPIIWGGGGGWSGGRGGGFSSGGGFSGGGGSFGGGGAGGSW